MKNLVICILVAFFQWTVYAQSEEDILLRELESAETDTARIRILSDLYYDSKTEPSRAENYAARALQLAKSLSESEVQSSAYAVYGDFLISQASYDSAIVHFEKALSISRQVQSASRESAALHGLGNAYFRKGSFDKAREYHFQKLRIAEDLEDIESIAGSLNTLGLIETEQGNFSKAMDYFTRSSNLFQQAGNLDHFATTLMSIGLIQRQLGNYDTAERYYLESDSINILLNDALGRAYVFQNMAIIKKNTNMLEEALAYNKKALQSFESLGNLKKVGEIHYTQGSISLAQKDYPAAIESYTRSLDYAQRTNDSTMIAFSNTWLGGSYLFNKDYINAEIYIEKGIEAASLINLEIIEKDGYEFLSSLNEEQGNFEDAYRHRIRFEAIKDSLYTRDRRELASEIEARYQNQQKQREIEFLEQEKELQTLQLTKRVNERNAIIAFTLITLVLALLLYNQYRIKRKANKELRQLNQIKSNFFANISHEFRTPLTLIKGPIDQLKHKPEKGLSKENIEMIGRNTTRVLKLVNQLLDLSKVDEGSLQLNLTEGDVNKCLRSAASSFNSHAAQLHIDYRVQIPRTVFWASFDRDKLEKIIYNLLGNAFKFSDDGAMITFDVSRNPQGLRIQIADSGIGIPEEKLPFIFDRFYQADGGASRAQEGTGIGLSLSKDLVELMNGSLTVTSEFQKGSCFTVLLPLMEIKTGRREEGLKELESDSHKEQAGEPEVEKADLRNVPSILMVEDNLDMRHFIREQMISSYKVFEAVDGEMGFRKSVSLQPDLIITDLMMPKMDGIELCQKLKTNVDTSHIPVIMLTAKAGIDNKIEGLETGADDYLTKPFDAKELLIRSKNLIEQRRKLRELFSKSEMTIDPKKVTVNSLDQKFLKSLIDLLEEQYSDPSFGVPDIQDSLAMSKTQLHRKVKALTNEAPGELLRNFRLKRAAQLLSQKADTVTQIAYTVGFNNLSYFAKCFKDRYQVSPSNYNS